MSNSAQWSYTFLKKLKLCNNLDWIGLSVCVASRSLTILASGCLANAGIHICYGNRVLEISILLFIDNGEYYNREKKAYGKTSTGAR
jgi:hypothetical protein